MNRIFVLILCLVSFSCYSQNIISNNWQTRFNGFRASFVTGSATPTANDSITVWDNNKRWKHFGNAFLFKDSLPILTSIGGGYLLIVDTTAGINQGQIKRILPANLGLTGTTIYTGNGSLSGDRTITGSGADLTFSTLDNFVVNSNYSAISKADGSYIYTSRIGATSANYLQIAYTPTVVGGFSKGTALIIDTNNNVITGSNISTTFPTYGDGSTLYASNSVVAKDNYLGFLLVNSNSSITKGNGFGTYLVDATAGNVTITLPNVSDVSGGAVGIVYNIKRIDNSGNIVTIQAQGSDLIDGAASITLTTQWDVKRIQSCGSNRWMIISN